MSTTQRCVAIVGMGPSGFYTAEHILRATQDVTIDFFDRLPTPFGLVRGGVAPDHPKIKSVTTIFDKIARDTRVRVFGNITVGGHLTVSMLRERYDAVVISTGAGTSTRLDIPGARLLGAYGATDFVGWYNGVPDCTNISFDLQSEDAIVIGHGNVAADIARILLTPVDELAKTDIAAHALEQLSQSRVKHVHLVGRRGPLQAKFSTTELRELGAITGCDIEVAASDLELNSASRAELGDPAALTLRKNFELLQLFAGRPSGSQGRKLSLKFLLSPTALEGTSSLSSVLFGRNELKGAAFQQNAVPTGDLLSIGAGLLFESIGFRGKAIAGVPFNEIRGVIPNSVGRVLENGSPTPGLYVSGWIKRGATGIIGANRADGLETAQAILEDFGGTERAAKCSADQSDIYALLEKIGAHPTSFIDWQSLDRHELASGTAVGKPREKIPHIEDMLRIVALAQSEAQRVRQAGDAPGAN
jgi:ferredoxin--NADP+ reductase